MAAIFLDDRPARDLRAWRQIGARICALGGLALLGAFWGSAVAIAGVNALYLCVSVIGCVFILRDFRVGVVLLIVLMPISRSDVFPHAMLGITGLNPLNLLLVGTLGSCLLQGLADGSIRHFVPRPLLWLYLVPFLVAGALGSRHVGDIAPVMFMLDIPLQFDSVSGYLRDHVFRPLLLVVFALLVGAAVSKSEQPDRFLIPMVISIWVMALLVIVFVLLSGVTIGQLSGADSRQTLSGLGMHANDLGRLYAVAYALLLFTWAESRATGLRLALLASMGLVVVALMLTFSRAAFFGFIVVNVLFLLWRRSARTLVIFGFLAAAALLLLPGAVYERMGSGIGGGLDAISAGRIEGIWLPLLPEVLRSPVFGSGLGSMLWSDPMRKGILWTGQAHNAYLETALDMGIAGLILVCAYFAQVWKGFRALSADPSLSAGLRGFYQGAAAGLASFMIAGIAGSFLTPVPEQIFLWLTIGMMYGHRARNTGVSSVSGNRVHAETHARA